MLNKQSPIPFYYQIAEDLSEQIRSGILVPDSQLPSERLLGERYAVSRMTIRQAVAYLVQEGLLLVKPGIGTFVAEPKFSYDALHMLGFTEEMMQRGGQVSSTVIEQTVIPAAGKVAKALLLPSGESVVKIVRLRHVEQVPLLLEMIHIPGQLCPGLEAKDLKAQSLYALLEGQYGLSLVSARQTLEASTANQYEQTLFRLPTPIGVIVLEGATLDAKGVPVEYFKAIYRGDRFRFELESRRNEPGNARNGAPRLNVVLA